MERSSSVWCHKDLLDIEHLSNDDIFHIFDTAESFHEINLRPMKKVPTLKGKSVVLFFAENSTRTKTSFDMAGKRLSADTFALGSTGSSIQKGESLKDTALTLQAMHPDVIVIRHECSGAARFLAERLDCGVVNAGDGWHAHPTQALLDGFTLYRRWGGDFAGKRILIVGDCAHSRVFRSDVQLFSKLGCELSVCAPRTLLPTGVGQWPVTVHDDLDTAVQGQDVVVCLRLQRERMAAGLLPDMREYSSRYCLAVRHLAMAAPGAVVMHPGPIMRGNDVSADVADRPDSLILTQVESGVAVRMAVLFLIATRNDIQEGGRK